VKSKNNCIWAGPYAGLTGNRYECGLVYAVPGSGGIANQDGDSGGPVYRYEGSGLYATGTVSASIMGSDHQVPCQYNTDEGKCWDNLYFTNMHDQLSEWNATMNHT
jgi:hypothetical protein